MLLFALFHIVCSCFVFLLSIHAIFLLMNLEKFTFGLGVPVRSHHKSPERFRLIM
jgi:hypothetical protein